MPNLNIEKLNGQEVIFDQDWFMKIMQRLGYEIDYLGQCRGIAYSVRDAFLDGNFIVPPIVKTVSPACNYL